MENIGIHIKRKIQRGTIERNIQATKNELNASKLITCQIDYSSMKDNQIDSLLTFINRSGMNIFVRTATTKDNFYLILKEVTLCGKVGVKGYIITLLDYTSSIIVDKLKKINLNSDVDIILKIPVMTPDRAIYNSPVALYNLHRETKCSICVDTCYVYSSGLNLSDLNIMKDFFSNLVRLIPVTNIIIHLNDSSTTLGSGKGLYALLGQGKIWEKNKSSLEWLLYFIKKYKIITILECVSYKYLNPLLT